MSLEQTIADLVAASNNLTGTINSKMNEIDQKVDEATASVPNTVKGMASRRYHIDPIEGDDSNTGNFSQPMKTIFAAIKDAAPNSMVDIRLLRGGDYICEVPDSISHHNSSHNKSIEIRGDEDAWGAGNPSRLVFKATRFANDASVSRCNFFEGSTLQVSMNQLEIATVNDTGLPTWGETNSASFGGVFTRGTTGGASSTDASLNFRKVNIDLKANLEFFTGYFGALGIYSEALEIVGSPIMDGRVVLGNFIKSITASSMSISGFTSNQPEDVFGYDATATAQAVVK